MIRIASYQRAKVASATVLALVAVGMVPWYLVAKTLLNAKPVATALPSSVFWGSLYFNTDRDLARWLHHRGVAYSVWASRHRPAAARIGRA